MGKAIRCATWAMACVLALAATVQAQAGELPPAGAETTSWELGPATRAERAESLRDWERARRMKVTGISMLALFPVTALAISGPLYRSAQNADACDSYTDSFCVDIDLGYGLYLATATAMTLPVMAAGAVLFGLGRRRQRRLERYQPSLAITRGGAAVGVGGTF